ncbi:MAG: hypothetical protein Q4A15_10600, partial [Prevotellaceae bacterium]|nr:hypothetical protein [Prevotellaceae bacterium]
NWIRYGCTKLIIVNDDAATPGVLEKISIISPRKKPHKSRLQRELPIGKRMIKYTYIKGVA